MSGKNLIVVVGVLTYAIGLTLTAFSSLSVNAEQPPSERCIAVPKGEYDSAAKQKLLRTHFTSYARTGQFGWRHYWYCHS
jgi:hypothetical protein